jgi:FlaA1/EpsC-like NDP-sugar epimerase
MRLFGTHGAATRGPAHGLRTLVVGAGAAGRTLVRDLRATPDYGLVPIAFLDDDDHKRSVGGLPVVGRLDTLTTAIRQLHAEVAVIAIPGLPAARVSVLSRAAAAAGAEVRVLPSFLASVVRDARSSDLRTVEIGTLLGRAEHQVGSVEGRIVTGKRVLVTGAGGSIGSELCRQVSRFDPAALCLLDHDESNLHGLLLDVSGEALLDSDEIVIADVRDRARIDQVFRTFKPELVFHAAAHKHLPLLELHPCEGVKTNVAGTQNLVEAALRHGAERLVNISTDKAADPVSVLGATKRLAELVVQANGVGAMSLGSVRFGNVLGSRGSFLTVLAHQIARGQPVTVTHPDVTRFFMTVEEAVGLVLCAASMAEFGETFVLDMGEPVRIVDLVHSYARQIGASVSVKYTGLRPGEKLTETLFGSHDDGVIPTSHPRISAVPASTVADDFGSRLAALLLAAESNDAEVTRREMQRILPEYRPEALTPSQRRPEVHPLAAPYADGF